MTAAIDYNHLKDLPDHEKAKIADILLKSSRGNLGGRRLFLAKQSTPENVCVEFWRVSSTDQRDGFSLKAQEEKAKEYSDLNSLKSSKNWSVSESASQEFDRKKFFEMIDYVTENGIKNVVFDKVDRACRGLRAAVVIEDLIESGVCFHFVRDNLVVNKESAPSEKLRFYLGVVLAKWYIDNLKSEIKKGLHGRLENGYFNAKAPVGYRNVRPEFGKANLEVHPEIGPFIADCFELYKTGNYSKKDLEKIGLERGIKWIVKRRVFDKNGEAQVVVQEKFVTHKALERVLSNPVYCHYRRVSKSSPNYKNCGGSNGFTGSKKGLTGSEGSTDSRGRGSSGSKRSWKSPGGLSM